MMDVKLKFAGIRQIVSSNTFWLIQLTNEAEERCIAVVCDRYIADQIKMRLRGLPEAEYFLPETLLAVTGAHLRMCVYDITDSQYRVWLFNDDNLEVSRIRISDACLLMLVASVPLYIEKSLWDIQSSEYHPDSDGVSIPINILTEDHLKSDLQKAVDEENYELAAQIQTELQRRQQAKEQKNDKQG